MTGLPERMRARAESVARGDSTWTPPVPRDAATVCLLRDGSDGLEVFLMRRTTSMAFAAGMHVYPGGAVERSDALVPLAGRADLAGVAARTSTDDPRALVVAAARETFEECGVLLAVGPDGEPVRGDGTLEADRVALVAGDLAFADVLSRRGLRVDDASVVPFAHWVTPEVEERRYDTRFFVTAQPLEQQARHVDGEADRSRWWRPVDALESYAAGRMAMLPPTRATLALLSDHDDVAAALAAARSVDVVPLMPAPYLDEDGSLAWRLLHERTREPVGPSAEPAASETDGVGRT